MRITFTIPFTVQPKQSYKQGRDHGYPDPKVTVNAAALTALMLEFRPDEPMKGPLRLWIEITYPWRKAEKKSWIAKGWRWKDTSPDWDNLGKQTGDVMEKMGFFTNDGQIADGRVMTKWGKSPRINVELEELE